MKHLNRDNFFITVLTFLAMFVLSFFAINIGLFNKKDSDPNSLQDSFYFKFLNVKPSSFIDPDIIIINAGSANRDEIGSIINGVASDGAKSIGLDIVFNKPSETKSTDLINSIENEKSKITLTGYFLYDHAGKVSKLELSDALYRKGLNNTYSNFISYNSYGQIKLFAPFTKLENDTLRSFAAEVVRKFSKEKYLKLLNRKDGFEYINYSSRRENYIIIDYRNYLNNKIKIDLKNKIVLIGQAGNFSKSHALEDYHYTPLTLNPNIPDMQGVFIHANIIRMVLDENYISEFPNILLLIFSFILTFIHVRNYMKYNLKNHYWFHFYYKVTQLISISLIFFLCIFIFKFTSYKTNIGLFAIPLALCVDIIYFSQGITKWLKDKKNITTFFSENNGH